MKLKKKEDQSVDTLVLLRRENKTAMRGDTETKYGAETEGKAIQTAPPGYPSHILSPNPDTNVDVNKCLMTGS